MIINSNSLKNYCECLQNKAETKKAIHAWPSLYVNEPYKMLAVLKKKKKQGTSFMVSNTD